MVSVRTEHADDEQMMALPSCLRNCAMRMLQGAAVCADDSTWAHAKVAKVDRGLLGKFNLIGCKYLPHPDVKVVRFFRFTVEYKNVSCEEFFAHHNDLNARIETGDQLTHCFSPSRQFCISAQELIDANGSQASGSAQYIYPQPKIEATPSQFASLLEGTESSRPLVFDTLAYLTKPGLQGMVSARRFLDLSLFTASGVGTGTKVFKSTLSLGNDSTLPTAVTSNPLNAVLGGARVRNESDAVAVQALAEEELAALAHCGCTAWREHPMYQTAVSGFNCAGSGVSCELVDDEAKATSKWVQMSSVGGGVHGIPLPEMPAGSKKTLRVHVYVANHVGGRVPLSLCNPAIPNEMAPSFEQTVNRIVHARPAGAQPVLMRMRN